MGKFGPYLESAAAVVDPKTGEIVEKSRANVPEDLAPDELTAAKAIELMETAAPEERVLGADPHTGHTVVAKNGRYGAYVTEVIPEMTEEQIANQPVEYYKNGKPKPPKKPVKAKPRTGSLFKSMTVESVTLDEA
ncbi:MAG: topA, partial [Arthrobacter sp.]|nr:topA [Arthrobacter sp.]